MEHVAESSCYPCEHVVTTASSGFIANAVSEDSNCGSTDCPWLIQVQAEQSITIKLLDFSVSATQGSVCRVLAVIKEQTRQESITVCTNDIKQREVYSGHSQSLEIRILGKANGEHYFLLHYEGERRFK